MKPTRTTTGLMLLVVAAATGFIMVAAPPLVLSHYKTAVEAGEFWGYAYMAVVGTGAALLAGSSLYTIYRLVRATAKKRKRIEAPEKNPSELSAKERERQIDDNLAAIGELHADATVDAEVKKRIEPIVAGFSAKREAQQLEIVAFGEISSGKSSLLNLLAGREVFSTDVKGGTTRRRAEIPWPGIDRVSLVDTPGLGEIDGAENVEQAAQAARDADVVLVVVDGPLHHSVFQLMEQLGRMEKRIVLCLNKVDWFNERDQGALLGQLRGQVKPLVAGEDVLAIRATPGKRSRVRVMSDGSEVEEEVETPPDISALGERLLKIVRKEGPDLLMANLLLQSRGLVEQARKQVQASLDVRAWAIVDKYMWGAAGAAALSPFPLVDIVTGCAISTKMVIDLGKVYRQEIDLEAAVSLLAQLGKNLIAMAGVGLATPAVTHAIGTLLKTVPGAGTIAGGMLQGAVQALITRWIGAVFIAYFRDEMQRPDEGLSGIARREWQRLTSIGELRKLVQTAREKFQ